MDILTPNLQTTLVDTYRDDLLFCRGGECVVERFSRSGLALFRRCRRRWLLSRQYQPVEEPNAALWFGTGFHFALEDVHGYKRWPNGLQAFEAYALAHPRDQRPDNWSDLVELAAGMLSYYEDYWLKENESDYRTLAVEDKFDIPIKTGIYITGTIDRIVLHEPTGFLYVEEDKTTSINNLRTELLDTDWQIAVYWWAANTKYSKLDYDVNGILYKQFLKQAPELPMQLQNGKYTQNISNLKYVPTYIYEELVGNDPSYRQTLLFLRERKDPFILQHIIRKNIHNILSTESQLRAQSLDAVRVLDAANTKGLDNPAAYPNHEDSCVRCPFRSVCISMDNGTDWQEQLADPDSYTVRKNSEEGDYDKPWLRQIRFPPPKQELLFDRSQTDVGSG